MKRLFLQNSVVAGLLAELLSLIVTAAVLIAAVKLFLHSTPVLARWFAAVFIPGILVVRAYAKKQVYPKATKSAAVTLFAAFVAFIAYLGKTGQLLN